MDLALSMDRFLVSSRELFNAHFRLAEPWSDPSAAWDLCDRYEPVRNALYRALVIAPHGLQQVDYGDPHPEIAVAGPMESEVPIMVNRERGRSSGYWDHPATRLHPLADLRFVRFFDWAEIERADHRYVMVTIATWPDQPDLAEHFGLIESRYARYRRA